MAGTAGSSGLSKGARITGESRERIRSEIRQKYESGASIRSLAESMGRSYGFVHKILVEADVKLRGRGGANRRRRISA
ncbi:helix-turn-helix domain-containing protein [Hoyosella sp. YIM 151337]|uniref:helix-turn-helix domain-containing protein n=1 Tax=Hoyosella sp. YIM 151337 TaxID=2992742 RepID=UPI00223596BA|nr:helix-turn-helix domain-containing protein [Hoyosella sp. YIM 151337]MCW4353156.1 helix-turn-helix domain-containing protein [Hoyosella sp. YIM 151337]